MSTGKRPSDWGVNHIAHDSIRIAYSALERFPDLVRRHKFLAGGAAISSSLGRRSVSSRLKWRFSMSSSSAGLRFRSRKISMK